MREKGSKAFENARGADANGKADKSRVGRLNDLNREMMRLPLDERRRRWAEYYTRLRRLMG